MDDVIKKVYNLELFVIVTLGHIFDYWRSQGFSPTMLLHEDGTVAFVSKDWIEEEGDAIWKVLILEAACARLLQEEYYNH